MPEAQMPIGTFRLTTNQSHTRFEGEDKKERKTYFGQGHPRASQGGDHIALTKDELDKFKNPLERLHLVAGNWSPALLKLKNAQVEDDTPKPTQVDLLLANTSEIVVGEIGELGDIGEEELELILAVESKGARRKSITDVCQRYLDELTGPIKKKAVKK